MTLRVAERKYAEHLRQAAIGTTEIIAGGGIVAGSYLYSGISGESKGISYLTGCSLAIDGIRRVGGALMVGLGDLAHSVHKDLKKRINFVDGTFVKNALAGIGAASVGMFAVEGYYGEPADRLAKFSIMVTTAWAATWYLGKKKEDVATSDSSSRWAHSSGQNLPSYLRFEALDSDGESSTDESPEAVGPTRANNRSLRRSMLSVPMVSAPESQVNFLEKDGKPFNMTIGGQRCTFTNVWAAYYAHLYPISASRFERQSAQEAHNLACQLGRCEINDTFNLRVAMFKVLGARLANDGDERKSFSKIADFNFYKQWGMDGILRDVQQFVQNHANDRLNIGQYMNGVTALAHKQGVQ